MWRLDFSRQARHLQRNPILQNEPNFDLEVVD